MSCATIFGQSSGNLHNSRYFSTRSNRKLSMSRRIRGQSSRKRKRFLCYCLYAFGGPLLIILLVLFIDMSKFVPNKYKIGISRAKDESIETCFVAGSPIAEMIYVYIPISCMLVVNAAFYSITAYKIRRVQMEINSMRNCDSERHSRDRAR